MTEKITIGIVGGGFGRRILLPVCLKHPQLTVKWLATKHNLPTNVPFGVRTTLRWEDIVEDSEVQAVAIATPHDLHAEQVRACLVAGKHVLCEKPLALSAKEAWKLAKRCDKEKRVGVVNYSFRYIPQRNLFQSLIADGLIGRLKLLRLSFFRNDFEQWPSQWYYDRKRGGGALIATGSHLIDSIHWLTQSDVRWVNAVVSMERNTDIGFSVMIETESDCVCAIDVSHRVPGAGSTPSRRTATADRFSSTLKGRLSNWKVAMLRYLRLPNTIAPALGTNHGKANPDSSQQPGSLTCSFKASSILH